MLPAFRADFLEKATARGVDRAAAEKAWAAVAEFASFGFCKAHAAAFAVPDVPVGVAEGALPGALPGRDPHPRPRDVPAPAAPGGRPAARHPDPAARRQRERARVRGRGDRRRRLRHPAGAAGRARHQRRRDPLDPAGPRRAAVPRRGGLPATDDGLPPGDRGARARRARSTGSRRADGQEPRAEPPRSPVRGHDHGARARGRPAHARRRRRARCTGSPTTPTPRS